MSYSNSFPQQRPTLNLDFANSGKLDSRLSYSRSSGGTYMSSEKHLSSLNLLTNSEDFTAWSESNATATANTTAAPDGTTTADTLTGNAGTALKRLQSNSFSADGPTFSFYAKAGTHNYIQIFTNQSSLEYVNFDLTSGAGAVGSSGSLATGAIQAVGSTGWYRCLVKVARNAANFTVAVALVDSTSAAYGATTSSTGTVHLWGAMANDLGDLTNVITYQSSGSQLHREFAPTLKTAAADAPRFEYATDGQSEGLLIEAQATNLQAYSSDFTSWSGQNRVTTTANVAIAPNGLLEADIVIANTSSTQSHNLSNTSTLASGTTYTASVYAKDAGQRYIQLSGSTGIFGSSQYATFDLQTGSVDANGVTASAVSVGNGWYRIQATMTATSSGSGGATIGLADSATASRLPLFAGNEYDGIILYGYQLEAAASASSLISTSGAAATKSADSCSVALNGFGVDVSMATEFSCDYVDTQFRRVAELSLESGSGLHTTHQVYNGTAYSYATNTSGSNRTLKSVTSIAGASQNMVSTQIGSTAFAAANGVAGASESNISNDMIYGKLHIGEDYNGGRQLNGHIRRVALYNTGLANEKVTALSN